MRDQIDADLLYPMVRGCITSFANFRGKLCEGIEDAHCLLDEMHQASGADDQEWYRRWRTKAKASGLYDDLFRFPPADAA
ncbi:MAG: hypothetical protein M3552_11345 [Planctomycetota bacterium]|nr:hypothetical protein [Planctomycetota bacterium]